MGAISSGGALVLAALVLFWIGMLGLLWRRSLVGMLVGLLFGWVSAALSAIGFGVLRGGAPEDARGAALVLWLGIVGFLELVVGLSIVLARIERRGTLDADDAGLLEG